MLSVVIRTKNEEENIERAIKSVSPVADEIIVIDDFSTDRTVEIAKGLGAKVVFDEKGRTLGEKLNYGADLSRNEWIFFLDADEELSEELRESIRKTLESPRYDAYEVARRTYYMGEFLRHVWYPEWRLRLFRKGKVRFTGVIHEEPVVKGIKVGKLKGDLYHYSYASLKHQYLKTVEYARKMAEILHKEGKRFRYYNLLFNPLWSFVKIFFLKRGFLEGYRGFMVAMSAFFYTFLKYSFLKEIELKEKLGYKLWKRGEKG